MQIPQTIFRYEAFNIQNLLNLKRHALYFASPKLFNDPYDCSLPLGIVAPTESEAKKLRSKFGLPGSLPIPQVKQKLIETAKKIAGMTDTESGVCCFTETNDNILMWSHYAGRGQGWCLEFRTRNAAFEKIRPVKYVPADEFPKLHVSDVLTDEGRENILDLRWRTKSEHWAHEREWRSIHKESGKVFHYDGSALKAVYFGPETEQATIEIVCLILAGQTPDAELWKGSRSKTSFKVEFQKFDYTPYIEAKRLGLRK